MVCSDLVSRISWVVALSLCICAVAPRCGDGDDMSVGGTSAGGASSTALASLTVVFTGIGVAIKTCKLCGTKSDAESPQS